MIKLAIVIPAYNEEQVLAKVLSLLPQKIDGVDEIIAIVVDDGSEDRTFKIAQKYTDFALRHIINLGVGAATLTGIEAAKSKKANLVVTMDADGQHNPDDIKNLIEPILKRKADVVIGARVFNIADMPHIKIIGNWLMNLITCLVFRRWVSDSQSGMKALSEKALRKMVLHSTGYEICSEIIGEAKEKKLKLVEIPIQTIYSEYSKVKGQNMLNAVNIFTRILFFKVTGKKR